MTRSLALLIPTLSLLTFGCSDDHEEEDEGYEDVILEGEVTDETMLGLGNALEAGDPVVSQAKAPTLDAPTDGASLSADTIPTFTWHIGAAARAVRLAQGSTRPAHGDPYSGYATYLEVGIEAEEPIAKVLTNEASWTPSAEVWNDLASVGEAITVTLIGAEFEQDRVIQDGGPYQGSVTQFETTP